MAVRGTCGRAGVPAGGRDGETERVQRHGPEQGAHLLDRQQVAVRRGVEQPECHVGHRPGRGGSNPGAPRAAGRPRGRRTPAAGLRTCSRASSGSDCQSRSWTMISGLVVQREVDMPVHQCRGAPLPGRQRRGDPVASDVQELLADPHQHLGEDGLLGGEVLVERRAGHAAGGAEVADAHTVEAAARAKSSAAVATICSRRPMEQHDSA